VREGGIPPTINQAPPEPAPDIGKKDGKNAGPSAAEVAEQVIESISRGATGAVARLNIGAIQDALKGGVAGAEKALIPAARLASPGPAPGICGRSLRKRSSWAAAGAAVSTIKPIVSAAGLIRFTAVHPYSGRTE